MNFGWHSNHSRFHSSKNEFLPSWRILSQDSNLGAAKMQQEMTGMWRKLRMVVKMIEKKFFLKYDQLFTLHGKFPFEFINMNTSRSPRNKQRDVEQNLCGKASEAIWCSLNCVENSPLGPSQWEEKGIISEIAFIEPRSNYLNVSRICLYCSIFYITDKGQINKLNAIEDNLSKDRLRIRIVILIFPTVLYWVTPVRLQSQVESTKKLLIKLSGNAASGRWRWTIVYYFY